MSNKQKRNKRLDVIAICCGLVLVAALIVNVVMAKNSGNAGVKAADIPADAVTLTGAAMGKEGDVTVEVVATQDKIYQIRVTDHHETEGIGSIAVERIPPAIYEAQSLQVDAVTDATLTSEAIKQAVRNALLSGGIDPAVFDVAPVQTGGEAQSLSYDVDVVVVGAGGAGMTAAIVAHDAGKDVLVMESMSMVGGNSVRSTGGMNAGKTDWQDANEFGENAGMDKGIAAAENYPDNERIQELAAIVKEQWEAWQADPKGYFDSVELFQLDTLIGGKALNDPALVKKLAESSADAIDWLDSVGIELHNVAAFGGASVKRIHRPVNEEGKVVSVGAYVVPRLEQNLKDRGIELLLDTVAEEILMDESGKAVGVRATAKDGSSVTVNAKAVVITTGGFGGNLEKVVFYKPELEGFMTTNASGVQGQGIDMAVAVGADTVDMDQIQIHPTVEANTASLITEGLRGDGAILINAEGLRFYDEVSTRDKVSAAEIAQTGSYSWLVVDSRMAEASNVIQGYIKNGFTVTGETYEELAEAMGVPAEAFAQTMETWNGYVAAKADPDFGRTSFANPLDTAPYYAIKVTAGIHHTMGGIKIDDQAQVIDTDGNVIPGLFAAGEVTGGVHGGNRLGGNAVADFTIFGRIAGTSASSYAG